MVNSTQIAFNEIYNLLDELIDSPLLNFSTESKDCLDVFDQYEWVKKPECDEDLFQQLKEKGDAGTMSGKELNDFLDMVSRDGQYHVYLAIREGCKATRKYRDLCITDHDSSPIEEYKVVAMSTAHLTEEDRDALVDAANDGDQMVLQSQNDFFIKLNTEESQSNYRHGHSETIKDIIRWAHQSGYRMIEFQCSGQVLPQFPVFDW